MKTRKLVLLIACGVLFLTCILQAILKGNDRVRVFELKDEPDELVVTSPSVNYTIIKEGENFFVGEKRYPANENTATQIFNTVKSIKVLDKVSLANNETTISKYELNPEKAMSVVVKKNGKTLRTIMIGKNSTAGSQCYITLDGGKDIYLATGNLSGNIDKSLTDLRTKIVYHVEKSDITSVRVMYSDSEKDFTVSRFGSGEDTNWLIDKSDLAVDPAKAVAWFDDLATVSTPGWHDAGDLSGNKVLTAELQLKDKKITLDIYEIPGEKEDDTVYYGYCSETPYQFEMVAYTAKKFQKNFKDLVL